MIRRRRTLIIAATVALLILAGALVVVFNGNDDKPLPPRRLGAEAVYNDSGEVRAQRRHYGHGYESRHGRPSAGQTDPSTQSPEEKTP